jgi:hypothetical protein
MNTEHCTLAFTSVELDKDVKLLIGFREAFDTGPTLTFDIE